MDGSHALIHQGLCLVTNFPSVMVCVWKAAFFLVKDEIIENRVSDNVLDLETCLHKTMFLDGV